MSLNDAWDTFPDDQPPVAPHIGPFAQRPFLEAVSSNSQRTDIQLHIEVSDHGGAAVTLSDGIVEFAGESGLTDYHTPVGENGVEDLIKALRRFADTPFRLDSLPIEASRPIEDALDREGIPTTISEHESTAVLMLPDSYDGWLASLGKKQRHEVRRKRRRFAEEFGEIVLERHTGDAIDAFCTMHRLSAGEKGQFMTGPMQDYFAQLLDTAGASIHMLMCDGVPRAAAFGFETDDGYYYYNSAYDPAAAMASPGIVLFSSMIETEIERGASIFDFLKGDEPYKYRHGAEPRQLFMITGRTP
ncbi:MAG: GNAT family N-acetyltransferase [Actinomycetota bacterium]